MSGPILKNDAHCYAVVLFESQTLADPFLACLQGKVTTVANGLEVHVGGLNGKKVAAAVVGEEAPTAAKQLETLLPVHSPSLVIATGTATALAVKVPAGSLFLAESVVTEKEGTHVELKFGFDAASLPNVCTGVLASAPELPFTQGAKSALATQFNADAHDRTAFSIAEVCKEQNVPCIVARVITASFDEEPPAELLNLWAQKKRVGKVGALLGALWKRPSSMKVWWQQKERGFQAADQLKCLLLRVLP